MADIMMRVFIQKRVLLLLALLTLFAGILRFTAISTPDQIAGDEHYFVSFSRDFQNHRFFFDVHPPLGKMIIAGGMHIFGDTPFGWRSMSALFGTALIPLLFFFGRELTGKRSVGLMLALLGFFDGLLFVLSRVAVMDIFLLDFLMLGYLFLLACLKKGGSARRVWLLLVLSAVCFGLASSVKWIGFLFLLTVPLLILIPELTGAPPSGMTVRLRRLAVFLLSAAVAYTAVWTVHLLWVGIAWQELARTFGILHVRIFQYHTAITETHAYESPWWSWPLLLRPWEYFARAENGTVQRMMALGNPLIWWPALPVFVWYTIRFFRRERWVLLTFLLLLLHWVPFSLIQRPMFTYHFLSALPFFLLPLAATCAYAWEQGPKGKTVVLCGMLILALSVWWFYPVWNAVPMTDAMHAAHLWLPGWDIQ